MGLFCGENPSSDIRFFIVKTAVFFHCPNIALGFLSDMERNNPPSGNVNLTSIMHLAAKRGYEEVVEKLTHMQPYHQMQASNSESPHGR